MSRLALVFSLMALAGLQSGCAIVCGGGQYPSPQRLHIVAEAPTDYIIRVMAQKPIDTHVPANGLVEVEVPISFRQCRQILFGVIPLRPRRHIEKERVIRVIRGDRVLRKLSAIDIEKLPSDGNSYHLLRIEQ
jgi:hypothetical protein